MRKPKCDKEGAERDQLYPLARPTGRVETQRCTGVDVVIESSVDSSIEETET